MPDLEQSTREQLLACHLPGINLPLSLVGAVEALSLSASRAEAVVALHFPARSRMEAIEMALNECLQAASGVNKCKLTVKTAIQATAAVGETQNLERVKNVIAVASGKGGVGKSTTAANLAMGLKNKGLSVGILDADIYGPSMPRLLGIKGTPESDGKTIQPMENYGVKCMSIGFLVDEETPMIWRGPMVQSAIEQMLHDVNWGELDVLVVDLPPGTGDAQLTMAQRVPLTGAVIVSTPQDLALLDARKGLNMFRKVEVPVLGIIENMSYFLCPHCGERSDIFGTGGVRAEALRLGTDFLGEVPLHIEIRETSDEGRPVVATAPDSPQASPYLDLADTVWEKLQAQAAAPGRQAPRIVVE